MNNITRRGFLRLSGAGMVTPYLLVASNATAGSLLRTGADAFLFQFDSSRNPEEVFSLSVASGDPTSAGVILWTRVDPRAWAGGENLAFEVALDPDFNQVLVQGLVEGSEIQPERDYTVKIDL